MASQEKIGAVLERMTNMLRARPSQAKVVRKAACEITDGLKCTVEAEGFKFIADMPEPLGDGTGPTPGTYVRGGFCACLAIGYAMNFAKHGLPWDSLRVEVLVDTDKRGGLGIDGAAPGFRRMHYIVEVESPADPGAIRRAIEETDSQSTELANFANPIPIESEIRISQTARAEN